MWLVGISMAVGVVATVEDLWRRTISNWLSLAGFAAGLAVHVVQSGWKGAGDSLIGAAIGFVVFLVFFLMGGMGGGDVKLMAAFGAILGRDRIVLAAIMAALVGGLLAALYLGYRKARRALQDEAADSGPVRKESIPYAPAISLGVLLSFLSEDELWISVC